MGLFSTLGVGYSGLTANKGAVDVTGHNLANATNENYTRQRAVITANTPWNINDLNIGTGASMVNVNRIHDEFVFARLKTNSAAKEFADFRQSTLEEVSKYFPDLDTSGIGNSLEKYFEAWNNLASNPADSSQKVALAQAMQTLSFDIRNTREAISRVQVSINDQLSSNIADINNMAKEIAELNKRISAAESTGMTSANDLRDKRDHLEKSIAQLVNINVFKQEVTSNKRVDTRLTDSGVDYHLNVAGWTLVDGSNYHPIHIDNKNNENGFYSVYFEVQDHKLYEITDEITGGQLGAMISLRGGSLDPDTNTPHNGDLQKYIDNLDSFAAGLIEHTNALYSSAAREVISSDRLQVKQSDSLVYSNAGIKTGSFDVVVYDNNGVEASRRTININTNTKLGTVFNDYQNATGYQKGAVVYNPEDEKWYEAVANGVSTGNIAADGFWSEVIEKPISVQILEPNSDDTGDNDTTNDVDDFIDNFSISGDDEIGYSIFLQMKDGYYVSMEDNGTNFTKINGIFDGKNAKDITLKETYKDNPAHISSGKSPVSGDNTLANAIVQMQYEKLEFTLRSKDTMNESINGFYRYLTTDLASDGENAGIQAESAVALFNAVNAEYQAISGVNQDEELANLIKFQTAYQASAKIITTVDQMLQTLLGMKQ
jgi:flagellar hook-associated protein 1 FlgK